MSDVEIEEKKKRRRYYYQQYKERVKKMSDIEVEEMMEQRRHYYQQNKEKIKKYAHNWKQNNRERARELNRRYKKRHPEKVLVCQRRLNIKRRFEVLSHYGGNPPKCVCCGENNIGFLTIDHINGGGRKQTRELGIKGVTLCSWIIRNNFPEEYQIMCYNCNCGREKNDGICPHKCLV